MFGSGAVAPAILRLWQAAVPPKIIAATINAQRSRGHLRIDSDKLPGHG
jgi:hypothetical protein